jgi:hypothetical protein
MVAYAAERLDPSVRSKQARLALTSRKLQPQPLQIVTLINRWVRRELGDARSAGCAIDRFDCDRQRRTVEGRQSLWGAAGSVESRKVGLHRLIFTEHRDRFDEDARGARMLRRNDAVVHPFPFAASSDDARTSQIGQVPRNLGLALPKDLHEITDAHFLAVHQV